MNFIIIRQVSILSFFVGIVLGLLLLVPVLNLLSFLFAMFFIGAAVVIFLKKFNMIGLIDIKEGAIIGSVAGFASLLGLCASYLPISSILSLIFKSYTGGFFTLFFSSLASILIGLSMVVFAALMSALLNSFSGLAAAWCYEFVTGFKKEGNENINFEIK